MGLYFSIRKGQEKTEKLEGPEPGRRLLRTSHRKRGLKQLKATMNKLFQHVMMCSAASEHHRTKMHWVRFQYHRCWCLSSGKFGLSRPVHGVYWEQVSEQFNISVILPYLPTAPKLLTKPMWSSQRHWEGPCQISSTNLGNDGLASLGWTPSLKIRKTIAAWCRAHCNILKLKDERLEISLVTMLDVGHTSLAFNSKALTRSESWLLSKNMHHQC